MIFSNTANEITIIHYSENKVGKQILVYAETEGFPIHEIDLKYQTLRATHWADIAERMGIEPKDLVNTEDSDFLQKFKGISDLENHDWLKLLVHNPDILRSPVVMKGDKVVMMSNPQDMLHFL